MINWKKELNFKIFGFYAAKCNICNEQYVGQTITSYFQRECSHRHNCKNMTTIRDKWSSCPQTSLYQQTFNIEQSLWRNKFNHFYKINKQPYELRLLREWMVSLLQANINMNKITLFFYRYWKTYKTNSFTTTNFY